jgi:hypothetical protein
VDNLYFIFDRDSLAIFVVKTSSSVTELNDEDVLLNARLKSFSDNLLEELYVLTNVCHDVKFRLECFPNIVRLLAVSLGSSDGNFGA